MRAGSISTAAFEDERTKLAQALAGRGISDQSVLDAIAAVPRHLFVPEFLSKDAYKDISLPISCGQTISQPYTVAFMTQSLNIRKGDKVLEVGTGSGYQAAVLAFLGARVFTVERHFALLQTARLRFDELKLNIASQAGDGSIGWQTYAPFDKIIVTAGAPDVPAALVKQLTERGVLVIPVGELDQQRMVIVKRRGAGFETAVLDKFKFVPLIGKEGWNEGKV